MTFHASAPGKPMQPTRRGTTLLAALDRPDIHALAMEHPPDMSGPASSRNFKHKPAVPGPAATATQQAAPLFRALAEPTRLAILLTLQNGEQRITDLAVHLGATQTAISSHITVLKDRGLITGRPHGRSVYYRLAQPRDLTTLLEAAEQLLTPTAARAACCETGPPAAATIAVPGGCGGCRAPDASMRPLPK